MCNILSLSLSLTPIRLPMRHVASCKMFKLLSVWMCLVFLVLYILSDISVCEHTVQLKSYNSNHKPHA